MEAEGPAASRGSTHESKRPGTHGERRDVGHHVTGVGEQDQRGSENRGNDFGTEEGADERERDQDVAQIAVGRDDRLRLFVVHVTRLTTSL